MNDVASCEDQAAREARVAAVQKLEVTPAKVPPVALWTTTPDEGFDVVVPDSIETKEALDELKALLSKYVAHYEIKLLNVQRRRKFAQGQRDATKHDLELLKAAALGAPPLPPKPVSQDADKQAQTQDEIPIPDASAQVASIPVRQNGGSWLGPSQDPSDCWEDESNVQPSEAEDAGIVSKVPRPESDACRVTPGSVDAELWSALDARVKPPMPQNNWRWSPAPADQTVTPWELPAQPSTPSKPRVPWIANKSDPCMPSRPWDDTQPIWEVQERSVFERALTLNPAAEAWVTRPPPPKTQSPSTQLWTAAPKPPATKPLPPAYPDAWTSDIPKAPSATAPPPKPKPQPRESWSAFASGKPTAPPPPPKVPPAKPKPHHQYAEPWTCGPVPPPKVPAPPPKWDTPANDNTCDPWAIAPSAGPPARATRSEIQDPWGGIGGMPDPWMTAAQQSKAYAAPPVASSSDKWSRRNNPDNSWKLYKPETAPAEHTLPATASCAAPAPPFAAPAPPLAKRWPESTNLENTWLTTKLLPGDVPVAVATAPSAPSDSAAAVESARKKKGNKIRQ